MTSKTDNELLEDLTSEIKRLAQQNMAVHLSLAPEQALALIGAVQLACRHPGYSGPSRVIVTRIVDRMQSEFLQYDVPATVEVIRRGWDQEGQGSGK